jgi:3-oxoacyl-[acyl-carrier protein] reductase
MSKKVLITGSTRGIGLTIAKHYLKNNWNICITGKSKDNLNKLRDQLSASSSDNLFEKTDFREVREVIDLRGKISKEWGEINSLIVNIGNGSGTKTLSSTFSENYDLFKVNFLTAFNTVRILKDLIINSNKNSITFIGSIASNTNVGAPINYAASKKAIENLSTFFSIQLSKYGVKVNCVNPGHVGVKDGIWDRRSHENPIEFSKFLNNKTLINRVIEPQEIASFVYSLSESAFSNAVTGSIFNIDGGTSKIKNN